MTHPDRQPEPPDYYAPPPGPKIGVLGVLLLAGSVASVVGVFVWIGYCVLRMK